MAPEVVPPGFVGETRSLRTLRWALALAPWSLIALFAALAVVVRVLNTCEPSSWCGFRGGEFSDQIRLAILGIICSAPACVIAWYCLPAHIVRSRRDFAPSLLLVAGWPLCAWVLCADPAGVVTLWLG